jgi:arylsulfatase A-like enzyme
MTLPLSVAANTNKIENVVIFVSDGHRFDCLPSEIQTLGLTAKAIAPSTFTASSLPSLLTGQYPATHGVWMFDDQLQEKPPLLSSQKRDIGFNAEDVWIKLDSKDKPPLQIHRLETESTLDDLESPFTYIVHDVGPHAPYGFKNGVFDSTKEFFNEHEKRRPELVKLYQRDCHNSAERFLDLYHMLEQRDILDSTLIVFTSDHGQCLGERVNGGRFGHGHPMCPENVEIPIVFIGAGLPAGQSYSELLSGTDIVPTLLSAQGEQVPPEVDGVDLWQEVPREDRKIRSDVWQHLDLEAAGMSTELSVYAATSAWNSTGGYVFQRKSRVERFAALLYDNLFRGYSPAWRENTSIRKCITLSQILLSNNISYGSPNFSESEAKSVVPTEFERSPNDVESKSLSGQQEEQLRDLGYLQ